MTARMADVVIIGGGIVGAACAEECVRSGLRVIVVEAAIIGGGATAAGMGHIVVMDDSAAQFALTRYSQQLWDAKADEWPDDVQRDVCGTLWVAADDEEFAEVLRKQRFYSERGVPVHVLDQAQLSKAEPNLRPGLRGGLLVSGDSVVYPPCAASHLLKICSQRGAEVRERVRVVGIADGTVQLDDGSRIATDKIVNATGTWAPELTPGCEVRKRKGHLIITDRYPNFVRHQLIELGYLKSAHASTADSVAFNVQPRKNGQLLIGSSRQFDVEHADVEAPMLERMIARALEYMPGLAQLSALRAWTGFRAATADHLPLVGPVPDRPGLYLATGHEGLGVTTAMGTARLLADQLLERQPAIPWAPYLPAREVKHDA